MRHATLGLAILVLAQTTSHAEDYRVTGRVVDANGDPVRHAMVSSFWRANGSPTTSDGQPYDLTDKEQNISFWGNVGDMQPFQTPVETEGDGRFTLTLPDRIIHLFAMDESREHAGIVEIQKRDGNGEDVEICMRPVITVSGKMESGVPGKTVDWSHVYVELPFDQTNPLAMRRVVSCGSYGGRFEFRLPPGTYQIDAYANSDRDLEHIDLRVNFPPVITIGGAEREIDVGTLKLANEPPGRQLLEENAKERGRWRDYTKHYGEPAPNWHAVDTRGIPKHAKIKDFRGKWLVIDFWGLGCAPCLANGIPKMMKFYDVHADRRDDFEIVGVCIDIHGDINDLQTLDDALAPIVTHVWDGRKIDFPIVLDNTFQTWERYGIPGLGTVLLVDPNGNLYEGDETTLHRILRSNAEPSDAHAPESSKTLSQVEDRSLGPGDR